MPEPFHLSVHNASEISEVRPRPLKPIGHGQWAKIGNDPLNSIVASLIMCPYDFLIIFLAKTDPLSSLIDLTLTNYFTAFRQTNCLLLEANITLCFI